jgi:hypothetical protein
VEQDFSPLDDALQVDGSGYTQDLRDLALELGTLLPFAPAARLFAKATGARLSAATVRRWTETVGELAVTLADEENALLQEHLPEPPETTSPLVLEADGAMVPLLDGQWAEVRLLVIGQPPPSAEPARHLTELSYVARLSDADTFIQQVHRECHRRGVETAPAVAAVQDGAVWLQGLVDAYRPDAVRILDWPHASQRLTSITDHVFGEGTERSQRAAARLRSWRWEEGPQRVLAVVACWQAIYPACSGDVAYLRERQAALHYPSFRQAGWPVGSGAVEGGHRLVMQARLKGPGMHWQRTHVNPLLALRELACNGRWDLGCPALLRAGRARHLAGRQAAQRQRARHPAADLVAVAQLPALSPPSIPFAHPWRRYGSRLSAKF